MGTNVGKEYPFVNWISLLGILLYFGGYVTVIFTLLAELLPSNARNVGSSLATTGSISSLFSVVTFCSIIFCYFFVPETFGKSLESIEDHYRAICYRNKIEPEMPLEITPNDLEPKITCDTKTENMRYDNYGF